jgi:hypothetical protein
MERVIGFILSHSESKAEGFGEPWPTLMNPLATQSIAYRLVAPEYPMTTIAVMNPKQKIHLFAFHITVMHAWNANQGVYFIT